MGAIVDYARKELERAGWFKQDSDYGGLVGPAVLKMVEQFEDEGHSGYSAPLCVGIFSRVALFKPLVGLDCPMESGDYHDVSEYSGHPPSHILQSTRRGSLFSEDGGKTWYDIDIRIPWWKRKFLRKHRAYVTFPYMPK